MRALSGVRLAMVAVGVASLTVASVARSVTTCPAGQSFVGSRCLAKATVVVKRIVPPPGLTAIQTKLTPCQTWQALVTQRTTAVNACFATNESTFNATQSESTLTTLCQKIGFATLQSCAAATAIQVAQGINTYCAASPPLPSNVATQAAVNAAGTKCPGSAPGKTASDDWTMPI
jgi:hypothetical protein